MTTPEQRARLRIDELLAAAGWSVQNAAAVNIHTSGDLAIRKLVGGHGVGTAVYRRYADCRPADGINADR
jgi:hypothetical protein